MPIEEKIEEIESDIRYDLCKLEDLVGSLDDDRYNAKTLDELQKMLDEYRADLGKRADLIEKRDNDDDPFEDGLIEEYFFERVTA